MRHRAFECACVVALALTLGAGCGPPAPRSFQAEPLDGTWRVAILPFANYTPTRDASARLLPILAAELGQLGGITLVDAGVVEEVLSSEPWLLLDRLPLDMLQGFGEAMGADALLVGSILGSGYRQSSEERVPHVSLSLRLLRASDGKILWSGVHARDGADGEWLFGLGRVRDLDQLVARTVREIVATLPATGTVVEGADAIANRKR